MKAGRIVTMALGREQSGFTLAEVMVAVAIIGLGIVGVSAGLLYATGGMEYGRQQTTAAFLAEQRLEQIKATALVSFATVTTGTFGAEAYGSIANAPNYRRTVTITNNPGGLVDTKLVEVTVFYRPVTGFGVLTAERQVQLSTLMADRK
jgi:prepilin-type N-terminal cleavage/methylation domain-containing protein